MSNKGVKFDKVLKRNRSAIQDNDISQKSRNGVSRMSLLKKAKYPDAGNMATIY